MNLLEAIKSSDIEIAELACNLLLEGGYNFKEIEILLKEINSFNIDSYSDKIILKKKDWIEIQAIMMKELHRLEEQELMWGNGFKRISEKQ